MVMKELEGVRYEDNLKEKLDLLNCGWEEICLGSYKKVERICTLPHILECPQRIRYEEHLRRMIATEYLNKAVRK